MNVNDHEVKKSKECNYHLWKKNIQVNIIIFSGLISNIKMSCMTILRLKNFSQFRHLHFRAKHFIKNTFKRLTSLSISQRNTKNFKYKLCILLTLSAGGARPRNREWLPPLLLLPAEVTQEDSYRSCCGNLNRRAKHKRQMKMMVKSSWESLFNTQKWHGVKMWPAARRCVHTRR